jgi:hypothetical protein
LDFVDAQTVRDLKPVLCQRQEVRKTIPGTRSFPPLDGGKVQVRKYSVSLESKTIAIVQDAAIYETLKDSSLLR